MLLMTRYHEQIFSEHIESIARPYGYQPFVEVTMTSGAKHVIHPDELRKAISNF